MNLIIYIVKNNFIMSGKSKHTFTWATQILWNQNRGVIPGQNTVSCPVMATHPLFRFSLFCWFFGFFFPSFKHITQFKRHSSVYEALHQVWHISYWFLNSIGHWFFRKKVFSYNSNQVHHNTRKFLWHSHDN